MMILSKVIILKFLIIMIKLLFNKSQSTNNKKKAFWVLILLIIFFVSIFLNIEEIKLPICLFKITTGYSCPGCGLSRSFSAISHLNFEKAIKFHLMGPIIYFVFLIFFLKLSIEIITNIEFHIIINPIISKIMFVFIFAVWLGFWAIRFVSEL